jgi:hypothetical protein
MYGCLQAIFGRVQIRLERFAAEKTLGWLSTVAAIACAVYGFWNPRFFAGAFVLFAALMYWLSIRWIDRNGSWDESS